MLSEARISTRLRTRTRFPLAGGRPATVTLIARSHRRGEEACATAKGAHQAPPSDALLKPCRPSRWPANACGLRRISPAWPVCEEEVGYALPTREEREKHATNSCAISTPNR